MESSKTPQLYGNNICHYKNKNTQEATTPPDKAPQEIKAENNTNTKSNNNKKPNTPKVTPTNTAAEMTSGTMTAGTDNNHTHNKTTMTTIEWTYTRSGDEH